MKKLPTPGSAFTLRKQKLLAQLSVPDDQYTDASPKGSVDAGIRHLIDQVNGHAGLVTTSSCAGRVSVYLEGRRKASGHPAGGPIKPGSAENGEGTLVERDAGRRTREAGASVASSAGGKGGGQWLFVSHDPVEVPDGGEGWYETLFGLESAEDGKTGAQGVGSVASSRLIHFKFEPMVCCLPPTIGLFELIMSRQILHILTASLEHAQLVIQAGMEAGFRETGAVSLVKRRSDEEAMPMVAVRSMGLSFESLVGTETDGVRRAIVPSEYLKMLVQIANERFIENQKRIARFSAALDAAFAPPEGKEGWEDAQARRERKRQEGLRRREELRRQEVQPEDESNLDLALHNPEAF